jgi:lysophospholipase L1-like esterase
VQDPRNPLRIRADLTADFVHPNTLGYRLMGESIDLGLFANHLAGSGLHGGT